MKITLFSLLILITTNSFAANWKLVNENPMGISYIDVDTISKHNNRVYFWRLLDYLSPSPIGVYSSVSEFNVDCVSEKITWLSSVYYGESMGKGKVIKQGTFNRTLYPRPESAEFEMMKFACNYRQLDT